MIDATTLLDVAVWGLLMSGVTLLMAVASAAQMTRDGGM